jgi:hypothetical protein
MEASENMNGLTTGENVTKDGNTEEHDTVVQNGFGDGLASKLDKVNGNHSVLVDNNSSNQSGNIDENEDNTNNQNAENSKDLEITKDRLRIEEDMDNSTFILINISTLIGRIVVYKNRMITVDFVKF